MDAVTYPDDAVIDSLHQGFVPYKISMLERHPETSRAVPDLYSAANLSLVSEIVSVLGARPEPASLSALTMMLGRVPRADAFVLGELGHLGRPCCA